jgi:hypothetical protein
LFHRTPVIASVLTTRKIPPDLEPIFTRPTPDGLQVVCESVRISFIPGYLIGLVHKGLPQLGLTSLPTRGLGFDKIAIALRQARNLPSTYLFSSMHNYLFITIAQKDFMGIEDSE